jgi:RNA polymerase subunit RPABC4/transcription elongation factor Spt4
MSKKECPSCAMMVDEQNKTCPVCEFEFPDTHKNKPWIILVLLGLVIVLALIGWAKRIF